MQCNAAQEMIVFSRCNSLSAISEEATVMIVVLLLFAHLSPPRLDHLDDRWHFFYKMKNSFDLILDNLPDDTIVPQLSDLVGGTAWASLVPGLQRALGDQDPQVGRDRCPGPYLSFTYNFVHAFGCSL